MADVDIVIFGASTDIGGRAIARLRAAGRSVRPVGRVAREADWAVADLSLPETAAAAMQGARVVVSCAHAGHVPDLLAALPGGVEALVLTGSAWRWSHVGEPASDLVRRGEAAFLASGLPGAMLHPTMIYGGHQENNLRRLVEMVRKTPVLPLPGGGRHLVQPVHVEDVAAAVAAAALRPWAGRPWTRAEIIPVPGPAPMPWRDMARLAAEAVGRRPLFVPVPLGPAIRALALAEELGLRLPVRANALRRFTENVDLSPAPLARELGIAPRPFAEGLAEALAGWGYGPAAGR